MNTYESLLTKSRQANRAKEYSKVKQVLTSPILEKYNRADLYVERGFAYYKTGEQDKARAAFKKAIEIDPKHAPGYNYYGNSLAETDEFDEALQYYNKSIEADPKYPNPHNGIGTILSDKNEPDEAIKHYNNAIKLDPKYVHAYNNIALIQQYRGEYKKALNNYKIAIKLDPKYAIAYNNIGILYYEQNKLSLALSYYQKAIAANPNFYDAYNNIGVIWQNRGKQKDAAIWYRKALKRNPGFFLAYINLSYIFSNNKSYDKCVEYYKKAIELNPLATNEYRHLYLTSFLYDLLEIKQKRTISKVDTLRIGLRVFGSIVREIRKYALDHDGDHVAHYTKLKVADLIINDPEKKPDATSAKESGKKLRYYNAVYMNDPREGQFLLEYFKNNMTENEYEALETAFYRGKSGEEHNIYLGSFLPSDHSDELVMWRTYGKSEENVEAAGCCFVIDTNFFDKGEGASANYFLKPVAGGSLKSGSPGSRNTETITTSQPLFRVLYYDAKKKKFVNPGGKNGRNLSAIAKEVAKLQNEIMKLIALKEKNKKDAHFQKTIDKIIFLIISEVRYFFKSSDYSFENEYRVIVKVHPDLDLVKIEESGLPRRLYIESNKYIQSVSEKEKSNYINEIILGPKVPNPERWLYLDAAMRKKGFPPPDIDGHVKPKIKPNSFKLKMSTCKYQ